jgi:hypothetical protein
MRHLATPAIVLVVILTVIQIFPLDRSSTPDDGDLAAPPGIRRVVAGACYDCHSNHTRWPWYSRVAPLSWIIAHHVAAARAHLNFSDWSDYASDPGTLTHKLDEIRASIADGTMAPWYYRMLHREARLDVHDRAAIDAWIAQVTAGVGLRTQSSK